MGTYPWLVFGYNQYALPSTPGRSSNDLFGRNYKLYGKIFWVSLFVTIIFSMSEYMLLRMLITLEVK